LPHRFSGARLLVDHVFGNKPLPVGPKDVKQLGRNLEKALGPKEAWRPAVLRELWSALFAGRSKRRRSADHERVFFQLLGYTLRPGRGYPLDSWRCAQVFPLLAEGVTAHSEKSVWIDFWILWRRIAAGLDPTQQEALWADLRPHLERRIPGKTAAKPKGVQPEGLDEMVRTAAALEHLSPEAKTELGGWIAARLAEDSASGGPWAWALGRLGARVPLYGSGHRVVPAQTAAAWLDLLLRRGLGNIDGAAFAAAQLARLSGDRARDVDGGVRARVAEALSAAKAPHTWTRMVQEVVALDAADEARALGDTLPAGLRMD
jgi:hypothetical protein